jgi:primosomal protein N' (replication factor Y)
LNAAALARSEAAGGRVVVVAPRELRPVQALLRWRPRWHADLEAQERSALHLPPAARMAALTGERSAVRDLLELLDLPEGAEVLGPVPVAATGSGTTTQERMLVRVPRPAGGALAVALKQATALRSARKAAESVRVELDPQQVD